MLLSKSLSILLFLLLYLLIELHVLIDSLSIALLLVSLKPFSVPLLFDLEIKYSLCFCLLCFEFKSLQFVLQILLSLSLLHIHVWGADLIVFPQFSILNHSLNQLDLTILKFSFLVGDMSLVLPQEDRWEHVSLRIQTADLLFFSLQCLLFQLDVVQELSLAFVSVVQDLLFLPLLLVFSFLLYLPPHLLSSKFL